MQTLRMGYIQSIVFQSFGDNSEHIFLRFILNADSCLHLLLQSSWIHLYLKSCTSRTWLNSRSGEQREI